MLFSICHPILLYNHFQGNSWLVYQRLIAVFSNRWQLSAKSSQIGIIIRIMAIISIFLNSSFYQNQIKKWRWSTLTVSLTIKYVFFVRSFLVNFAFICIYCDHCPIAFDLFPGKFWYPVASHYPERKKKEPSCEVVTRP